MKDSPSSTGSITTFFPPYLQLPKTKVNFIVVVVVAALLIQLTIPLWRRKAMALAAPAACTHEFLPLITNHKNKNGVEYSLLEDTKQCDDELASFASQAKKENNYEKDGNGVNIMGALPACSEDELVVELLPVSHLPNGTNILPYVTLNISARVNTSATTTPTTSQRWPQRRSSSLHSAMDQNTSFFIQFRCAHSPNTEDRYCHDHSTQLARWGRMIWPCRRLLTSPSFSSAANQLAASDGPVGLISSTNNSSNSDTDDSNLAAATSTAAAFAFSYDCFHLYGHSQYEVNLTLLSPTTQCSRRLQVTAPAAQELDPAIRRFYLRASTRGVESAPLSFTITTRPLLWLDTSQRRFVRVYLHYHLEGVGATNDNKQRNTSSLEGMRKVKDGVEGKEEVMKSVGGSKESPIPPLFPSSKSPFIYEAQLPTRILLYKEAQTGEDGKKKHSMVLDRMVSSVNLFPSGAKPAFQLEDLYRGNYLLYAYRPVPANCQLHCTPSLSAKIKQSSSGATHHHYYFAETLSSDRESDDNDDEVAANIGVLPCQPCPYTRLNFTLTHDYLSAARERLDRWLAWARLTALGVFLALLIASVSLAASLLHRRRRLAQREPQHIELGWPMGDGTPTQHTSTASTNQVDAAAGLLKEKRPCLLILYTDDSEAYSRVVLELAELLEEDANVRVLLDKWAFGHDAQSHGDGTTTRMDDVHQTKSINRPGTKGPLRSSRLHPQQWLMNALTPSNACAGMGNERDSTGVATAVLVLFSDCSQRVLLGNHLLPRGPLPNGELFLCGMRYVLAKLQQSTATPPIRNSCASTSSKAALPSPPTNAADETKTTGANKRSVALSLASSSTSSKEKRPLLASSSSSSNSKQLTSASKEKVEESLAAPTQSFLFASFDSAGREDSAPKDHKTMKVAMVPDYLTAVSQQPPYLLPDDLPRLVALLHLGLNHHHHGGGGGLKKIGKKTGAGLMATAGMGGKDIGRVEFHPPRLPRLETALAEWRRYKVEHPCWMEERFGSAEGGEGVGDAFFSSQNPPASLLEEALPLPSMEEADEEKWAERYGVERPPPFLGELGEMEGEDVEEEEEESGIMSTEPPRNRRVVNEDDAGQEADKTDEGGGGTRRKFRLVGSLEDFMGDEEEEGEDGRGNESDRRGVVEKKRNGMRNSSSSSSGPSIDA